MRRSIEDVRAILLTIEELDQSGWTVRQHSQLEASGPEVPGVESKSIAFHLPLLIDGGLVTAKVDHTLDTTYYRDVRLTWKGHDFVDAIRSDTIWTKLRKTVSDSEVKTASFAVWSAIAADLLKKHFGLS